MSSQFHKELAIMFDDPFERAEEERLELEREGFKGKMKAHKIFAVGAMGCMLFSVLSGYKMISSKSVVNESEEAEKK